MEILLTGATGFVGSYVLDGLLRDGHSVCIVKRRASKTDRIEKNIGKCRVYDWEELTNEKIYKEAAVECIIHCATHYGRSGHEYLKNIESNLLFPMEVLYSGAENGVKYFINTDTFFGKRIQSEEDWDEKQYLGGYVLSKNQFRQWGRMMAAEYGMGFINMRLEHVYGEKDDDSKFIPYIVSQCKSHVPAVELSGGNQERDFIHISDVVNAYKTVIHKLEEEELRGYMEYGVGTGRSWRLQEFVEIIHEAVKSRTQLKWGAVKMKNGEIMHSQADNIGLRKLGWNPCIVDKQSIERVFSDWGGVYKKLLIDCFYNKLQATIQILFCCKYGNGIREGLAI